MTEAGVGISEMDTITYFLEDLFILVDIITKKNLDNAMNSKDRRLVSNGSCGTCTSFSSKVV